MNFLLNLSSFGEVDIELRFLLDGFGDLAMLAHILGFLELATGLVVDRVSAAALEVSWLT